MSIILQILKGLSLKKAMITIEILISILILFLVIATSVTMIKQLRMVEQKEQKYENIYIAFSNISNYLEDTICTKGYLHQKGIFSNVSYDAKCKLISKQKSYQKSFEEGDPEGNIGDTLLLFYEIDLLLSLDHKQNSFKYYKTIAKKLK